MKGPMFLLLLYERLFQPRCVEFLRCSLEIAAPPDFWGRVLRKDKGKQAPHFLAAAMKGLCPQTSPLSEASGAALDSGASLCRGKVTSVSTAGCSQPHRVVCCPGIFPSTAWFSWR